MNDKQQIIVFGEVLFDCFPDGAQVLGGAPFNVAWHLAALGDRPRFVSRVGDDALGRSILDAMREWGMDTSSVQVDAEHPTGHVQVEMSEGEPNYTITPDVAYDFIDAEPVRALPAGGVLYHGSLALRNPVARAAFQALVDDPERSVFLDVNLRAPWWTLDEVHAWLTRARWAKMNEQELLDLGFDAADVRENMEALQARFSVEQVIVTRGKKGVLVRDGAGAFHEAPPRELERRVDPVGAGDAFSAVYLHGLCAGRSLRETLDQARDFAEKMIGIRGATPSALSFYEDVV